MFRCDQNQGQALKENPSASASALPPLPSTQACPHLDVHIFTTQPDHCVGHLQETMQKNALNVSTALLLCIAKLQPCTFRFPQGTKSTFSRLNGL